MQSEWPLTVIKGAAMFENYIHSLFFASVGAVARIVYAWIQKQVYFFLNGYVRR